MISCTIPYLLGSILYLLAYHLDNVGCIYAGRVLTGDLRRIVSQALINLLQDGARMREKGYLICNDGSPC